MTEYFKNLDVSRYNLQTLGFPEEVINELYAVFNGGNLLTNDEMRSVIEQLYLNRDSVFVDIESNTQSFDTRISSGQIRSTIYKLLSDDKFGNSNPPETIAGWLFLDEKNDVVERLTDEFVEKYGRRSTTLIQIYDFLQNHPYYSNKLIPNLSELGSFRWTRENRTGVIKNIKSFKLKLKIKEILKKSYNDEDNQALSSYIEEIQDYNNLLQLFEMFKKNDIEQIEKIKQSTLNSKENKVNVVEQRTMMTSEKQIKESEEVLQRIKKDLEGRIIRSFGNCEYSRKLIDYINEFLSKSMPKFYVLKEYLVTETEKNIASNFSSRKYLGSINVATFSIVMFAEKLLELGIINNKFDIDLDENVDNLLNEINVSKGEGVSVLLEQILSNVKTLIEKMIETGYKMDEISVDILENLGAEELYKKLREISSKIRDAIDEAKIAKLRILNFSLPGMPSISEIINVTKITLEDIEKYYIIEDKPPKMMG